LQKVRSLTSPYGRNFYSSQKDDSHLLLLGDSHPDAILTFLTECFHSDHGNQDIEVVILRDREPSDEVNNILNLPQFESRVIYVKGDPLNNEDLKRCNASKASCCVIMNNTYSTNPKIQDQKNILSAFAVK
jgi:hypothetical protein